ncbi:MAG: hypothetical protein PHV06_08680, partial [bacterium]|nr:hypothetical protein [bacterium]
MKRIVPFITGFISIIIQTALIREYLIIFKGNELLIGLFFLVYFSGWAIGGFFIKLFLERIRDIKEAVFNLISLYFIAFFFSLMILHLFCPYIEGVTGKMYSFGTIIIALFSGVFPLTFLNCLIFSLYISLFSSEENPPGRIYFIDGFGGFFGGVIFSFILFRINNIGALILGLGFILLVFIKVNLQIKLKARNIVLILFLLTAFLILDFRYFRIVESAGQKRTGYSELFLYRNSPYGNYAGLKNTEQEKIILFNGISIFAQGWTELAEQKTDFMINLHPGTEKKEILLLGFPGVHGLNKFKGDETKIVFRDSVLFELFPDELKGFNLINKDPRLFLKNDITRYDLIWVTFTEPLSISDNRFFTLEFMRLIKEHLNDDGLVYFNVAASENYISERQKEMLRTVYFTLQSAFQEVRFIPGDEFLFISSQKPFEFTPEVLVNTEFSR